MRPFPLRDPLSYAEPTLLSVDKPKSPEFPLSPQPNPTSIVSKQKILGSGIVGIIES